VELKIDSEAVKGPLGLIVAVLVVLGALGWMHMRRASLIEQGRAEVVRYLETELPARYVRQLDRTPDPERIEQLRRVEVVSFSPSLFFRADRDDTVRVKTVVRIGTGETATFYFRFKSVLGRWQLRHEVERPLLDAFR
jgi:hypothetical protein